MNKHFVPGLRSIKKIQLLVIGVFAATGFAVLAPSSISTVVGTASAACQTTAPATTYGKVTQTVSVPAAGTYRVWSRIKAPNTSANSYFFSVDTNACYYNVGDSTAIPANTWTWVNYESGSTTTPVNVTLTAGTHTLNYFGREADVQLDRVLLLTDTTCVPTGIGDNCAVTDGTPPTVSVTGPAAGSSASGTITLSANASDASGIAKVDFLVDGSVVASDTTSGYSVSWNSATVANGTHTIVARATDATGNTANSSAVTITTNNVQPATLTLNDSLAGTGLHQFNYSGTWTVGSNQANAYQNDTHYTSVAGNSYQVQFNGTKIELFGEKNVPIGIMGISIDGGAETMVDGYASSRQDNTLLYSSPTLSAGTHTVKVRVTGNKNAAASGTYVGIDRAIVYSSATGGSDTTAPTVSMTATPSSITLGQSFSLTATATDNVGVSRVEFLNSVDEIIATDTSAPYTYAWTPTSTGTKTPRAKAYDAAGNSTSSTVVSVSVGSGSTSTPGDVNKDGRVNALDLSALISNDGENYPAADFNGDGTVGAADMAILLSKWTW